MADVARQMQKTEIEIVPEERYSLITTILFWCGLVVVSSLYITIPMVSIFANKFSTTLNEAVWTSSAFSFSYAIGFLFFGPLSDHYGRKQIMLFGMVILCLVSPVIGLVSSLSSLVVLRAIQGIAAATFAPAALAYIVDMYPIQKRVTAVGFVSTGFLMAGIVGQVLSSLISQTLGWPYVFYLLGAIYFFSAILLGSFIPKAGLQQKSNSILTPFQQMGKVFFKRSLFFCYITTITLLLSFVGMYTVLGNFLSKTPFELNNNGILWVRAVGIIGMLLSPFAGRLVARFDFKRVLRGGLILAVVGLGILGISTNLPFLILMSIVFVAGISISVPTLISLIGYLGGSARGAAVTLYTFILFIGATLGPIIALSLLKIVSYTLTFEILALLLGIGLLSTFLVQIEKNQ